MTDELDVARTLLIADDDEIFRSRLARAFSARGFVVLQARDGAEALALCREEAPELVVLDLRMPGPSSLDVIRELRTIEPATQIVVLTGYGSIATAVEAMRLGAVHYLTKPAEPAEILAAFAQEAAPATEGSRPAEEAVDTDLVPSLARVEWEHIQRVLADTAGNVSKAARLLGLHRRSLQRKLSKAPVRR